MALSKYWLKSRDELDAFLVGAKLTAFLSKDLHGKSFDKMDDADIEDFFSRSRLLWGCSSNEYALIALAKPEIDVSLTSAMKLAENQDKNFPAILVPYQDGGLILITQNKFATFTSAARADWWRLI